MGYIYLSITIIAESIAVIFMKLSLGFQHKFYTAISVVAYLLSFIFLILALKYLPAGISNAIWAGASTILVAILGVIIFKEQLTWSHVFYLAVIITGIVGLQYKSAT